MADPSLMEKIVSLCKRRGFVFPGSEIYGGLAGIYDFGPRGVELLNNLKHEWWKANVYDKDNYYGLDSGMFKNPRTWEASGHTAGFSDPLAECRNCHARIRVDKALGAAHFDPVTNSKRLIKNNGDRAKKIGHGCCKHAGTKTKTKAYKERILSSSKKA